jgi:murein DD-endopeptidase MepM/ murein hydrolase activator NlpD
MIIGIFFLALALSLSSCDTYSGPVRVINLGLHPDSSTGAMIVGAHDNLYEIAQRYRLPVRGIIDLNHLEPPYRLAEGQRLKLPAPVDYRVRPGDTLPAVAGMFGVSASQLVALNNIPAPYRISPGQDLRIPEGYHEPSAIHVIPTERVSATRDLSPGNIVKPPEKITSETLAPPVSQPLTPPSSFLWPVRGRVISGYGPKDDGLYNDGINIAAPRGTPVAAAADGVIAYVGNDLKSYGNLVLVRHGGGTMTAYAHLGSMNVRRGMAVRRGQVIGTVGATGAVPASQLHFEIRHGSKTCDPRAYLG